MSIENLRAKGYGLPGVRPPGAGRKRRGTSHKINMDVVEREIARLAFFDPRRLIALKGLKYAGRGHVAQYTLQEIAELPDDVAACISSFDVVIDNLSAGDNRQDSIVKVRWYDKREMLALLAKHFGYVTEKVTVGIEPELRALLDAGRARNAARLAAGTAAAQDAEVVAPRALPAAAVDTDAPAVNGQHLDDRPLELPTMPRTLARRGWRRLQKMRAARAAQAGEPATAQTEKVEGESDSDIQFMPPVDIDPPPPEI